MFLVNAQYNTIQFEQVRMAETAVTQEAKIHMKIGWKKKERKLKTPPPYPILFDVQSVKEHLEALTRSFVEIDEQLSTRAPGQKKYRYEYGMNKIAEP